LNLPETFFRGSYFWIITIVMIFIIIIVMLLIPADIQVNNDNHVSRVYFADNISIAHQELINRFNKEHEGEIEVIPVDLPFQKFSTNERKELLARSFRSRSNRIDVFAVDVIWVPRFARWCEPLDDHFSQEEIDGIIKDILFSCYYNDTLYAVPHYNDIGMMYYRRDLLEALPDAEHIKRRLSESITWEEFIELSTKFDKDKNPFYLYAADNFEGLICSFLEGLAGLNQSVFEGDSLQLNTPGSRKTLQLLVDLVHKYKMTPSVVTKYDEFECYIEALKSDAVFLRGWPGLLRHYKDFLDGGDKFQYFEKSKLPHFKNGNPAFILGGWNLMLYKFSSKKNEALKFIKFALREENQKLFYDMGGYLPVKQSVYDDSAYCRKEPDLLFYSQLLKSGVHRPYLVDYTKISDIISYYVHLAIKNEISVSEALKQATALVNANYVLIK